MLIYPVTTTILASQSKENGRHLQKFRLIKALLISHVGVCRGKMRKSQVKSSRGQMVFSGIILPIIVIIWMIGWILVVIGSERTLSVSTIEKKLSFQKTKIEVKPERKVRRSQFSAYY